MYASASSLAPPTAWTFPDNLCPYDTDGFREAAEEALRDVDYVHNGTIETLQAMVLLSVRRSLHPNSNARFRHFV